MSTSNTTPGTAQPLDGGQQAVPRIRWLAMASFAPSELEDGRQRQVSCGVRRRLHILWLIAIRLGAGLRCGNDRLWRLPPA